MRTAGRDELNGEIPSIPRPAGCCLRLAREMSLLLMTLDCRAGANCAGVFPPNAAVVDAADLNEHASPGENANTYPSQPSQQWLQRLHGPIWLCCSLQQ